MIRISGEGPMTVVVTIKRKLKYYRHQTRKQALAKVMIEGRVEGSRGMGRSIGRWEDGFKQSNGWSIEGSRKGGIGNGGEGFCIIGSAHFQTSKMQEEEKAAVRLLRFFLF